MEYLLYSLDLEIEKYRLIEYKIKKTINYRLDGKIYILRLKSFESFHRLLYVLDKKGLKVQGNYDYSKIHTISCLPEGHIIEVIRKKFKHKISQKEMVYYIPVISDYSGIYDLEGNPIYKDQEIYLDNYVQVYKNKTKGIAKIRTNFVKIVEGKIFCKHYTIEKVYGNQSILK